MQLLESKGLVTQFRLMMSVCAIYLRTPLRTLHVSSSARGLWLCAFRGVQENYTVDDPELGTHTHSHALQTTSTPATTNSPSAARWAASASGRNPPPIYSSGTPDVDMAASAIGSTGCGQAHNNMQPYLGLNYCICLQGVFPSRN
jgi:microcystin-dependent protein